MRRLGGDGVAGLRKSLGKTGAGARFEAPETISAQGRLEGVLSGGRGDLAAVEPHAELHAEERQEHDGPEHRRVGGDLPAVGGNAAPSRGRGQPGRSRR